MVEAVTTTTCHMRDAMEAMVPMLLRHLLCPLAVCIMCTLEVKGHRERQGSMVVEHLGPTLAPVEVVRVMSAL